MPETFFVEMGSVLRRWDRNAILTPDQIKDAIRQLAAWPLRVAQVRAHFADASYVSLAEHLGAELLTDDHKLANAPTLTVGCCDCRSPRELPAARSQLEDDPGAQRTKAPRLISAVAQRYV